MEEKPYPRKPCNQWSKEEHGRWMDAANAFGIHLLEHVRADAVKDVPLNLAPEIREVALEAIDATLWHLMELLDGFYRNTIDEEHAAEYVLTSRIWDSKDEELESIELAPNGDGLPMGFAGWLQGHFGQPKAKPEEKPKEIQATPPGKNNVESYDEENVLTDYVVKHFEHLLSDAEKREFPKQIRYQTRSYLLETYPDQIFINRCPHCNCIVRTPQAKMCFWCGFSWHNPIQTNP